MKSEAKAEIRKKRSVLKAARQFSLTDSAVSKQGVLDENDFPNTPQKKSLRDKSDRSADREDKIIILDDLQVPAQSIQKTRAKCWFVENVQKNTHESRNNTVDPIERSAFN